MKKILATGAMLAYIAWFNSTGAVAATMPEISVNDIQGPKAHQGARREKSLEAKVARLAQKFDLDADELHKDLTSKKSIKDILKKHGITKHQLREVMGKTRRTW
jgi:tRNA nucleotidyltransferase/poly(A) polymerase